MEDPFVWIKKGANEKGDHGNSSSGGIPLPANYIQRGETATPFSLHALLGQTKVEEHPPQKTKNGRGTPNEKEEVRVRDLVHPENEANTVGPRPD